MNPLVRMQRWSSALLLGLLLALWEVAANASWISVLFFPPPSQILLTLVQMCGTSQFWLTLGITLYRMVMGVLLGATVGLLLGWLMGANQLARATLDPIVAAVHPLPKVAIFPIFLVLFGLSEWSKIAPVALAAFFPMLLNTFAGVRHIDHAYWEVAKSYGAAGSDLVYRIILPGSLPMVMTGLRLAVNDALVVTIAIEMLSAERGLGALIWMTWQTLRTDELYATLIIIGALGMASNGLLRILVRYLLPWQQEYSSK